MNVLSTCDWTSGFLGAREGDYVPRDNFNSQTIDRLAKRAGMKCSFPDCRSPTSGPGSDLMGVTNTGVAAHIHAASPAGPRYDDQMTVEERGSITNGIWLCQTHAKIIDDDEIAFSPSVLREWKETAEHMAALEAIGYEVRKSAPFAKLETKAPTLLAEMKADLQDKPLVRQFILLSKRMMYNAGSVPFFVYFYEDHEYLDSLMTILQHSGAIYDIAFNDVPRYNFTEQFVEYLIGKN